MQTAQIRVTKNGGTSQKTFELVKKHRLQAAWTKAILTIKLWQQRYRTRQQLASLDQYALKDIGLSRSEAIKEAQKSFWKK
jgi:uncharacterized protein YjiS (DUF1127 family)